MARDIIQDCASRFWTEQHGSMSYLGLTTAFVMMAFGGIGADLMHAELKRTKMQNALDRAVLAAASIENERDAESVVREYFRVQDMEEALVGVTPVEDKAYRQVTAGGRQVMPTNFIQLLGIDNLQAEGLATAENGVTNIEIALILDISGSMTGRKIEQLKQAASTFVDNVLGPEASQQSTSVSIVPYNATVNMGTVLPGYIALDRQHDYSNCAVFAEAAFSGTALDASAPLEQLGQFDPYSNDVIAGQADRHWCHGGDTAAIVVHSSDPAALKDQIATLTAGGNTAIDVGMKWGVALLDPAARGVVGAMADDGLVDAGHAQRPDAYGTKETQKFIVLMTDGKNTTQYDLKPGLKSSDALTGIFVNTYGTEDLSDDDYSVRVDPVPGLAADHFPAWSQAISNFVMYFDTDHDGALDFAHKIEAMPDTAPRDLDVFLDKAVRLAALNDPRIDGVQQLLGVSIEGGPATSLHFAVRGDRNGPLADPGPVMNTGPVPGETWSFADLQAAAASAAGAGLGNGPHSYFWTRLGGDEDARYQPRIDGLETNSAHVYELTYNDLFHRFGTRVAADLLFARPYADGLIDWDRYQALRSPYRAIAGGAAADARLSRICGAAKREGVVVYAIGVEAPEEGRRAMRDCASSASHFFDVEGDELENTFSGIARNLTQLRLIQ
ncbi:TadE/TadG family type IV pilus assembly protein [Roseivivax lentus]|uniref:TadE/TadG family type IV pilus assembly protein n=1 Tax=Roseivivax lentus TaxID=633194 RepID=UPI0009706BB9|nr:TadE/TadG family type IV pilus assembly protein [Roseivivax lentus]